MNKNIEDFKGVLYVCYDSRSTEFPLDGFRWQRKIENIQVLDLLVNFDTIMTINDTMVELDFGWRFPKFERYEFYSENVLPIKLKGDCNIDTVGHACLSDKLRLKTSFDYDRVETAYSFQPVVRNPISGGTAIDYFILWLRVEYLRDS